MHQVLEGAVVGTHNYKFRENIDTVNPIDLSDDYVCYLSGHIHRYQKLENPLNEVPFLYPGSIERTSYQEAQESKGYCKLQFIKENGSFKFDHEFIELPTRLWRL